MLMNCWIIQLLSVATVLLPLVVAALENADVQISHLRPSVMIARGVETITIEGTNFVNDDNITCFFDDEPKAGMWISSTKISCPTPTSTVPRIYQVRVSSVTSIEQQLEVISPPSVASIAPTVGIVGTNVTLRGASLHPLMKCQFGDEDAASRFINTTLIECTVPDNMRTGNMSMSLMLGDVPISLGTPLSFTLVELSIASILPSFGDTNGGTPVTVSVTGKQTELLSHCIFGDEVVPASMIDSRTVQCMTPPMQDTGPKLVGLSVNGDDSSMSSQTFEFTHPASFSALTPANGPELGGTIITISGSNFVNSSDLACYFGDFQTRGEWMNSEEVSCVTPALRPGSYDVGLSFNGIDILDTTLRYRAYLKMTALAAVPSFGVATGGSQINVYGTNFRWEDNLYCRFGDVIRVNATVVGGSNIVECVTPKWDGAASVELSVLSGNGDVAVLVDKFDFYAPFQVLSMHPNNGFMRGGTSVIIYGKHFSQARGPIHCVFGETSVEGRVETDTKIGCLSPTSNTGGDFHLAIRHGSDEFKLDSTLFSYDNEILIDKSPLVVALSTSDKIVDVHGSFFRNTTDLACRMMPQSKQLDAVFITASLVECRLPEGVFPGEYEVIVSNNGQDFSTAFLPLLVIDPFRVHSITPSIQFRDLMSTVTIKGSNFLELDDLWCIIDDEQATRSHFISSTIIECSIPEDSRVGTISVSLMLGDVPISLGTPLSFTLVELSIASIFPSFGDANGGTPVTVMVTGKQTELVSHCIFGDEVVPASMIDLTTIQCMTPPMQEAGPKLVGLSVNGGDFSMSSQTFEFTHPASFSALTPANGPELGGTIITISGSNFVNNSDLACYFGDVETKGEWMNSEEVSCVTPALRPGSYDVWLSFNGIDTHRTSLKFLYNFAIDILSVTPSMGSVHGGTVVSIRGKSFTPTEFLSCRFGDNAEVIPAIFVSSTEVSCISPDAGLLEGSNSTVNISVSLNGVDFSPATAQFLYSLPAIVRSVHPIRGSVNGGTEVIIEGDNFTPSTLPSCIFGNDSVSATVHSESQMSCISPMHVSNEAVRFSVTLNGFDEAQTQTESGLIEFTYLPAIRALQFEPNSGPSVGGTIITVIGFDFDETFDIRCKFGSHVVNATVVSNESIKCKSPPHPFGIVQFAIISEETDVISSDAVFEFYKPPRILSANPVSGPHHGNAPVKIYGDFFRSTTEYICHFGDIPVQGEFLTVDSILCLSPEIGDIEYSHVDLTITDREANFTQSSLSFSYVQLPTLKSLSPMHVFFEGGDSLVITGEGFNSTEEVWCRFSPTMPSTNISTDVITVRGSSMFDEENVACTTPSYPPTKVQMEVLVELSTNGHDWSTNNLSIYYVPNLSITGVFPSLGSVDGGTSVSVYGTGFFEGDDLWCNFGVAGSVAATFTSYNELSCVTPSTSFPRNVPVSLSFMGSGDYVSSSHSFTYHRQLSLVEATPLRGFSRGGTAVTITGTGFVDVPTLSCRFGSIVAEANFISQNMIECLSPPVDEMDKAILSISLNGVDFVSDFMNSNITSFQYDSEAEIDGIVPKNVPMSVSTRAVSTEAETRHITLFGKGFINTTTLYCSYATCNQITSGTFITESEVRCSLPQSCKLGEANVRISFNGVDFSEQASTILFVSPAIIADTYPKRVQEGSEMEILVSGDNFVQSSELQCYFGSESFVSKPARWISNSSLMCTSPPLNLTYNGFQSLYISNNGGHDLSNSFGLGVTARSRFLSIQPSVGYIDGGTEVNITLSNVQYVSNLSCQFGQQKSIPAELVSANVISCVSPSQHIAGSVTVKVFSDDIHLLAAGSFQYLNPPFLSSLRPNMGLIEGGSIVFVSGNNFVGVTTCRFSLDDGAMKVTRATVTNDTAIVCQVPSADRPADALVELSHNGQDYVGRELRFSYKERPRIHSIVPSYGSDIGGKMVHILGENFIHDSMMVHFGDSIVRASVISPKLLSCVTPSLKLGHTSVSISADDIDFVSDDALHYESIQLPQISDVIPKVGIIGRQTRVIVNTTKLFRTERLSCHFGDMTVMAVSISPNAVSCMVPKVAHVDVVNVTLSVDGERHLGTSGNQNQFAFVVEPRVTSAAPSIGWTNGGDLITFEVVDMAPFYSSTLSCLFGGSNDPVKAVIDIENSSISCVAPEFEKETMEERAVIELSIDDSINTIRIPTKEYTYIHPSIVTKIDPPLGSIRGGSLVKVTGVNFSSMTGLSLFCLFGNDVVDATLQGDDIICRSPEWRGGPKKIIVSVGIGNNTEMVLESHATFEYLNHPSISQIRPRFGTPGGGTAVIITGNALAWMDAHKYLSCQFGNSSFVPAKAVEDGLLCVSPPLMSDASMVDGSFASNLTLYANHGSVQLASSDELFIYTDGVKINSLSTNSGPFSGGTVITLSIDGFRGLPTDDITCKFDKFESIGTYSKVGSNEYVKCITPAVKSSQSSRTVLLQLGIDGAIDSFSNGELITLYPPQTLTSVLPSYGFFEGGEEVLVTGTYFRNTPTLSCFFGNVPSPQTVWISDTSLMCTSPFPQDKVAAAPRSVNVTVTNNGVDFTNGSRVTEYHYIHRPDATTVEPFVMNENNRTSIVIRGKNLEHVNACLYGVVKRKYQTYDVTHNSVSCDVPKVLFEGPFNLVPIFLSLENGIISTGLDIRYEAPPVIPDTIKEPIVSALEPRSGASAGGGWIRVTGEGFLSRAELACVFGTLVVTEVEYVSSSEIRCLTPKHLPGSVPFSVTNGGLQEDRSKSFVFTFVSDVSISSIFPSNGSIEGGTITRIYGSFSPMISPRIEPTCKFGSVGVVEGVLVSQNEIHCVSPPAPMAETVELRLSIDGGLNYLLSSSWFSYVHASEIEALIPRYGYRGGGTPILVVGRNFRNETNLTCNFGESSVSATFISFDKVTCIHPPHQNDTDDQVIFTLSSDSGSSTSWKHFEYIEDPVLTSIHPSVGTSLGGADVVVRGSGFRGISLPLYCVFGDAKVRAVLVDSSTMMCAIPRHPHGKVNFRVVDQFDHSMKTATLVPPQFEFVPEPSIETVNINPTGNASEWRSMIFARGSNFRNSSDMSCYFGGSGPMKARALTETIVICETQQQMMEISKMVNMSISHSGYTSQSLLSVELGELSTAPNGTIMQFNATSCEPGSFKPRSDHDRCLPCPVGYFCPMRGMSKPLLCREGYICSELGLVVPSSPCVAGHYCPDGTKSSYPVATVEAGAWLLDEESGTPTAAMDRSLWDYIPRIPPATGSRRIFHPPVNREVMAQQPLPCPVSFFCRKGVKSAHHVDKDFTTPQKCFDGHFCPRGSISPEGTGPCPEGHYCSDNFVSLLTTAVIPLAIPCDVGHYCPGTGNTYPRACFPGSYSPTTGRSTCILCEVGRQCPTWGMSEPELCAAGFVCDIEGISTPSKLCPAGYYCDEGTTTTKPYTSIYSPKPCPSGSACPSGTAHNITGSWLPSLEMGRIAPQPCSEGYHCPQNSSSIMGGGQCPPGHYCPPQSAVPIKVPPGTYAGEEGGAIAPSLCLPGTFSPQPGSISCAQCPAGYSCLTYGTYIPRICDPGTYRSKKDSLTCKACPKRTFSPYSGLTDVSQCLPCPEGLVCGTQGMSDIGSSHSCPEGNACGYLIDSSTQYDHKCAAGQYCGRTTKISNQYDNYCLEGTFCERGTTKTRKDKNECNRGYYCKQGTPCPEPITSRCPRQTTSLLGSEEMTLCFPESVAICDKVPYIQSNVFNRMSYYPLDESVGEEAAWRETAVVQRILPFNGNTSNIKTWKNDTVETIRACPSYMVQPGWTPKPAYGVRTEDTTDEWKQDSITIIGRNFVNSTTLTCRYRTCLDYSVKNDKGAEIIVPGRCFYDLEGSNLSEAETRNGTFISDSRTSCPIPNTLVYDRRLRSGYGPQTEDVVSSSLSLCLRDDKGRPYLSQKCSNTDAASGKCSLDDVVPSLGIRRRIYSLVVPCSVEEISQGSCPNVPSSSLKLNPCFTSQVIVDVSNNGKKFSSTGTIDVDSQASSQRRTYSTYFVIDEDVLDAFESENNSINRKHLISSFESDASQCNIVSSHEEALRLDGEGWFEAAYMSQFHLSFDWRLLPNHLVYNHHFKLAIHVVPSRCMETKCSTSTREISSVEESPCLQPVALPEWFTDDSIDKNQVMNITLLSLDDSRFRVEVQLMNGLALPFANFFESTMTLIKQQPQRANTDLSVTRNLSPLISWEERTVEMPWIFGIRYDKSLTSLPLNLPPRWENFERGRVLVGMNTTHENIAPTIKDTALDTEERRNFWSNPYLSDAIAKESTDLYRETFHGLSIDKSTGSHKFELNSIVLPYLPYFSNCREFDSYIPLWALVESTAQCKLPKLSSQYPDSWWRRTINPLPHRDDVLAIGPTDFMAFYPIADWCERKLYCSYEETLSSTDVTPRWFEADSGTTLFSIIRDPIDYYQYTGRDAAGAGPNDGGGQRFLKTVKTLETFIPAKVSRSPAFNVEGECAAGCFPRRITVDISYYQLDVHSKRIVQVDLRYDKFDKDTTNDEYELQFKYYPLNYQELVTKFAFTRGLFLVLFSYIGVGTVVAALLYWIVIRLTTSLESPPQLRVLGYLWLTFPPALGGFLLGLIPVSIVTAASFYLTKGYMIVFPDSDPDGRRWLFSSTKLQYSDMTIDPDLLRVTCQGRSGLAFATMAIVSLYFTTTVFVPKKDPPYSASSDVKPAAIRSWKRSNLLVSSLLMSLLLVAIVEGSFWESFGTYIWEAIILMKVLGIVIGQVVDKQLGEALLSGPVMTAFALVQAVITMSANDFMDFLLSYIVGFGFLILERMYIGPLQGSILSWTSNLFFAMAKSAQNLLPSFLRNDHDADNTDQVSVHEENEETLEPLLGSFTSYSCDTLSLLYFPFIMVVIMIFRDEAEMMKLYNIKESDMEYYLLFALVIIPFQILADIFMQHSLELLHGWKTYEYLQFCRVRFLQREMWWKGLETNTLDECIEESLRSVDQMCFSSQYYMLNTLHVNGIIYLVLGIVMMTRAKYNAFGDPAMSSIIMIIFLCSIIVKFVLTRLAMLVGLWSIKYEKRRWHERARSNEEPKIDQGTQEQTTGHGEYKLEERMTSDTFRYKFLRYNRSWIIDQMPNMLTPRTTQRSRPYVMNQLARILGSIDADISSDSEADDTPEFDAPSMNASTRAMLRTWFGEASRLLRLSQLVEAETQKNKRDACQYCLSRGSLRVEACYSVEEMNCRFIEEYPECKYDIDQILWKSFWQRNQKYQTTCFPCLKYAESSDDDTSVIMGDLMTKELDDVSSSILKNWYNTARKTLNR